MPTCINCDEEFVAKRKDATLCSPKCRMAWSRKNAAFDNENAEAKQEPPTRKTSHVVALKEKVKARILAKKGGLHELLASIPDDIGPQTPEEAVEAVQAVRGKVQELVTEGIVPQKTADAAVKMVLNTFTPHPVEHYGTQNDLAKSVISKVPVTKLDPNSPEAELARLEKSQLRNTKKKD